MNTVVQASEAAAVDITWPLVIKLRPAIELTEDQFFMLCAINEELCIERNAVGELEIMAPVGGETGEQESEIIYQLRGWAKRDGRGRAYNSNTGFRLPNSAVRAPDAAWVLRSRVDDLPRGVREKFLPLCPDFVVELRSPSDTLPAQQAKMEEYIANGARLGFLLDPGPRHVYIYRPDAPVERLDNPEQVSGEPVLTGFVLDLREVW